MVASAAAVRLTDREVRRALGLSEEEAERHAEAARRRRERERLVRAAEAEVERLAGLIGRLHLHVETCRGDVAQQERERWDLVILMHRLTQWIERQRISTPTNAAAVKS